jgi:hypothetical protein
VGISTGSFEWALSLKECSLGPRVLYIGRIVWNRLRYIKGPDTGKRISHPNEDSELTGPATCAASHGFIHGIAPLSSSAMIESVNLAQTSLNSFFINWPSF